MAVSIKVGELRAVEQSEADIGKRTRLGAHVGGFLVGDVVLEGGQDFLILEDLAGELLDQ